MGLVYADLELINAADLSNAKKFIIGEEEIHRIHVRAFVDSGSGMMCINDTIVEQLQLDRLGSRRVQLADGTLGDFDLAGPIEVRFKNRTSICQAIVLPDNNEVLLGAIPMEDMDVLIHPLRNELIIHPDHPVAQVRI